MTQAQAVKKLAQVIEASGLTQEQWAKTVAIRERRTVTRWLAGESPIPQVVIEVLLK